MCIAPAALCFWVLPGNNTNAGQGKPGIFAHKTKKIWACYVTYSKKLEAKISTRL